MAVTADNQYSFAALEVAKDDIFKVEAWDLVQIPDPLEDDLQVNTFVEESNSVVVFNVLIDMAVVSEKLQEGISEYLIGDEENFKNNIPFNLVIYPELTYVKLKKKSLKVNENQEIPASLTLVEGTSSNSSTLDIFNYQLLFTSIATVETAPTLKERIDTFVRNNQGVSIELDGSYTAIGNYEFAKLGIPYFENGERRVNITWNMDFDFVLRGVFTEEVEWSINSIPLKILGGGYSIAYSGSPSQFENENNVKGEVEGRSLGWNFTLPYTLSPLMTLLRDSWIMPLENNNEAFSSSLVLGYKEGVFIRFWNVKVKDARFVYEAGKIIALNITMFEVR